MGQASDEVGASLALDLQRGHGGVAAGDGQQRVGVGPPQTLDQLARLLVADVGDGAGVDDAHICSIVRRDQLEARIAEALGIGVALRLVDLAAKRGDRDGGPIHEGIVALRSRH